MYRRAREIIRPGVNELDVFNELQAAAVSLKRELAEFAGVVDISDTFREGKRELRMAIKPEADHTPYSRPRTHAHFCRS